MTRCHRVDCLTERLRLDQYLQLRLGAFPSRSSARKAIKRGEVLVDGEPANPALFVREGHRIDLLPSTRPPPKAWQRPLRMPYVDPWLAVVDKPPGIPVSGNQYHTLVSALVAALPPSDQPDALRFAHPVHRLDIRTSGLVVCARTGGAQVGLGRAFEERRVQKRYRALVVGRLEGRGVVEREVFGRPAVSAWCAVRHTRSLRTEWVTTVDLWPRTGRQHQLRQHLASLGHPILGDDLYDEGALRSKGLHLCSVAVAFDHPVTGARVEVELEEPAKFESFRSREARRYGSHFPQGSQEMP